MSTFYENEIRMGVDLPWGMLCDEKWGLKELCFDSLFSSMSFLNAFGDWYDGLMSVREAVLG